MLNFVGIFGHVNIDYIMKVDKLPAPNTCIQVDEVKRFFGGTGANMAVLASKLGVKTSLASFVGTDFPDDFRDRFIEAGVDITDLREMENFNTPTCRLLTDPNGNQIGIMDQGPMGKMDNFDIAEHTVKNSQIIHVGTGRPKYYKRVMELAKEQDKRIHFDPAQEIHYVYSPAEFAELLQMSNVLFVNESELAAALKYQGKGYKTTLLEHVETLIITLGKNGSQILHGSEILNIPAIVPAVIRDPTGAGDAYRAGFYAGLSRGLDLEKCGLLGASAASFVLEVEGPLTRPPSWEEISERAENVR